MHIELALQHLIWHLIPYESENLLVEIWCLRCNAQVTTHLIGDFCQYVEPFMFPATKFLTLSHPRSWLLQEGQWPSSKSTWIPSTSALRALRSLSPSAGDTSPTSRCLWRRRGGTGDILQLLSSVASVCLNDGSLPETLYSIFVFCLLQSRSDTSLSNLVISLDRNSFASSVKMESINPWLGSDSFCRLRIVIMLSNWKFYSVCFYAFKFKTCLKFLFLPVRFCQCHVIWIIYDAEIFWVPPK